jgi:tRNA pseudouridine55 synthase
MNFEEGEILLFDKPLRWTSFDLVRKVNVLLKKNLKKNLKVGHAGTLDPLASGLMIICTGRKTKELTQFQGLDKEYIATIELGKTTPSFDLETEVDKNYPFDHIDADKFKLALKSFLGDSMQTPPLFSAKRINGTRAYEHARKGSDMVLDPSKINISEIELIDFSLPKATIKIKCSKGTYIRSLARDIGLELNSGGHLIGLQRTAIGNYRLEDALSIEEFEENLVHLQTE